MSSGRGYLSPGGASGFPFAAPARMFCNELRESIHSGKNWGVECSLPAGVWVRGRRAACWAACWAEAGWGGQGASLAAPLAPFSARGDLSLGAVCLSVCLSVRIREAGWLLPVPQTVRLPQDSRSFVLFLFLNILEYDSKVITEWKGTLTSNPASSAHAPSPP